MEKNVAGIWIVYAYGASGHANPGDPITGLTDISAEMRQDGGAADALTDLIAAELQDGYYYFDISAAENNFENLVLCPSEGTVANVTVVAIPAATWTRPPNFSDTGISATGIVDANLEEINNVASAAVGLSASADTILQGACTAGTTGTTIFSTDLATTYPELVDDSLNGRVVIFKSGSTPARQVGRITSYTDTGGVLTIATPLTVSTVNADAFIIV